MIQARWDSVIVAGQQRIFNKAVQRRPVLRCQAGAAAAEAAAQPVDIVQQLLTRRSYAPPRYIGPVQVSEVPGVLWAMAYFACTSGLVRICHSASSSQNS